MKTNGWARYGAAISCLFGLVSCADCNSCRKEVVFGQVSSGPQARALDQTAAQFLGTGDTGDPSDAARTLSAAPSKGGDAPPAGFLFDPDILRPDADTPYRLEASPMAGLRLSRGVDLGRGFGLEGAVFAGVGEARYELREGIGALRDPTQFTFRSVFAAAEGRVVKGWNIGTYRATLGLGAGREISRTRTTVRSALLDVTNHSGTAETYATLGLGLRHAPSGLDSQIEARRHADGLWQLRGELRLTLDATR